MTAGPNLGLKCEFLQHTGSTREGGPSLRLPGARVRQIGMEYAVTHTAAIDQASQPDSALDGRHRIRHRVPVSPVWALVDDHAIVSARAALWSDHRIPCRARRSDRLRGTHRRCLCTRGRRGRGHRRVRRQHRRTDPRSPTSAAPRSDQDGPSHDGRLPDGLQPRLSNRPDKSCSRPHVVGQGVMHGPG
jgi:hypothetical protein